MNGYSLLVAIIATLTVVASAIAENVEPVLTFIGGGAATGVSGEIEKPSTPEGPAADTQR